MPSLVVARGRSPRSACGSTCRLTLVVPAPLQPATRHRCGSTCSASSTTSPTTMGAGTPQVDLGPRPRARAPPAPAGTTRIVGGCDACTGPTARHGSSSRAARRPGYAKLRLAPPPADGALAPGRVVGRHDQTWAVGGPPPRRRRQHRSRHRRVRRSDRVPGWTDVRWRGDRTRDVRGRDRSGPATSCGCRSTARRGGRHAAGTRSSRPAPRVGRGDAPGVDRDLRRPSTDAPGRSVSLCQTLLARL